MANFLSPPIAFVLYVGLVALLYAFGRLLAPNARKSVEKSSLYAGGEEAATHKAAPGYRRFFIVALFFAVLHLGALVMATMGLSSGAIMLGPGIWVALLIYMGGLSLALLIMILS